MAEKTLAEVRRFLRESTDPHLAPIADLTDQQLDRLRTLVRAAND